MKNKRNFWRLQVGLMMVILLTVSSCGVLDSNDEASQLLPLEGGIYFALWYPWDLNASQPEFILQTEKYYPYSTHSIIHIVTVDYPEINVDIRGVRKSGDATSPGPAQAEQFLNLPHGEYTLNFRYLGLMDKYALSVTDSTVVVTGEDGDFTGRFPIHCEE